MKYPDEPTLCSFLYPRRGGRPVVGFRTALRNDAGRPWHTGDGRGWYIRLPIYGR